MTHTINDEEVIMHHFLSVTDSMSFQARINVINSRSVQQFNKIMLMMMQCIEN